MKLSQGLAALVLMASAWAAHAEVTGTVTAVSDYDFRGVTQTAQGPALQGSLDYAHDSGFYAGAWASNVDFGSGDPNIEIDMYSGFASGETFPWDVGIIYYTYAGASALNYPEIYASLGWKFLEAKVWYSWDYGGNGGSSMYYEGNVNYELPANFGLTGHVGYSDGNGIQTAYGQGDYTDWSAGVTYALGNFSLALKWVDGSDLKSLNDAPDDVFSSDARAVFSISTTFPWAKDGD